MSLKPSGGALRLEEGRMAGMVDSLLEVESAFRNELWRQKQGQAKPEQT